MARHSTPKPIGAKPATSKSAAAKSGATKPSTGKTASGKVAAVKTLSGKALPGPTGQTAASLIDQLEHDHAALKTELAAARQRIQDLEARQADIADRIAWALDSLHDLAED